MPKLNPKSLHGLKPSDMHSADSNWEERERTILTLEADKKFRAAMIKAGYRPQEAKQ